MSCLKSDVTRTCLIDMLDLFCVMTFIAFVAMPLASHAVGSRRTPLCLATIDGAGELVI